MRSTIDRIKEWVLNALRHNDNLDVTESESNTQEVVMPITDDNQFPNYKDIKESGVKKNTEEASTDDSFNTLLVGSNLEDDNNVVFDEIEPVAPLKVIPKKDFVNADPKIEEQTLDKLVDESKLVSLTVDTIKYYDKLRCQMPTDDLRNLLDDVCRNLIDNLIIAGCAPINEEPGCFDMSKHRVEPFEMVEEGVSYSKVIRKGVEYQNEVKILAVVEL